MQRSEEPKKASRRRYLERPPANPGSWRPCPGCGVIGARTVEHLRENRRRGRPEVGGRRLERAARGVEARALAIRTTSSAAAKRRRPASRRHSAFAALPSVAPAPARAGCGVISSARRTGATRPPAPFRALAAPRRAPRECDAAPPGSPPDRRAPSDRAQPHPWRPGALRRAFRGETRLQPDHAAQPARKARGPPLSAPPRAALPSTRQPFFGRRRRLVREREDQELLRLPAIWMQLDRPARRLPVIRRLDAEPFFFRLAPQHFQRPDYASSFRLP
jgi:hypothetical protein